MINVSITFDEKYEFIKLYDILRDMDFELTDKQQSVFEKIESATIGDQFVSPQFKFKKEESNS